MKWLTPGPFDHVACPWIGGAQGLPGEVYTLDGTVAQHDAGSQVGTGYTVSGGYWVLDLFAFRLNLQFIRREYTRSTTMSDLSALGLPCT